MFSSDEIIEVTSGTVKTPDASLIDNVGGSRATKARITNRFGVLLYRFDSDPDASTDEGHLLQASETTEITGYDNIKNLRFTIEGVTTSKVFISYGN